ncbi:MAG: hypothetical protein ABMA26_10710 [Limisphaerales bacterium]
MIADEPRQFPALGSPAAEVLEAGAFCREIVAFVERELPVWRQRPELAQVEDEPRLNQSLCLHLDKSSRRSFDSIRFVQEPIQGSGRNADIGVFPVNTINMEGTDFSDHEQLLPIECKRLPTPPDSRRSDLEYVHGLPGHRTGGIERFKHGSHGRTNQRALMIAYVQADSLAHWMTAINARLTQLAANGTDAGLWSPCEPLSRDAWLYGNAVHRLTSSHRRLTPPSCSPEVAMDHLWLLMN